MGNEKIAKLLPLHVIPNDVPKMIFQSLRGGLSSVVTCGFEDSAERF